MTDKTIVAPPMARADTPMLVDADGMQYLNIEGLRERGDLVAGYDPNKPDIDFDNVEQIRLNRELEIARENAKAEEAARLEAEKRAAEIEAEKAEAERIAKANEMNKLNAEAELQREREEHAQQMAEMRAKMEAMAKQLAERGEPKDDVTPDSGDQENLDTKKKPAPKRRTKKAEEPAPEGDNSSGDNDLDEFDN